jgi:hypothetical protein
MIDQGNRSVKSGRGWSFSNNAIDRESRPPDLSRVVGCGRPGQGWIWGLGKLVDGLASALDQVQINLSVTS